MAINDTIYAGVDESRLLTLFDAIVHGQVPDNPFVQHGADSPVIDPYRKESDRFAALRQLFTTRDVAAVIQTLKDSGLRGMGGAGFPTGVKWEIVRNAVGDEKYVVVNADESEPGTFKDRFLMEKFPHLLIEGILLGAFVVGAKKAFIFLRHEYPHQEHVLAHTLDAACVQGVIGTNIHGSDFSSGFTLNVQELWEL